MVPFLTFLGHFSLVSLEKNFQAKNDLERIESNKIQEKLDRRRNKEAKKRKREILDPDTIR